MIKLSFVENGLSGVDLIRGHGMTVRGVPHKKMSSVLTTIRQGTTIKVENPNPRVEPHRGQYYILFVQEINTVFLFYLDVKGNLRYVYSGNSENATSAIYSNIANETELTVLKSDGKRGYRVATQKMEGFSVVPSYYKNRSSKVIPQVYMKLFDAINFAVSCHSEDTSTPYFVITKDDGVMFRVG